MFAFPFEWHCFFGWVRFYSRQDDLSNCFWPPWRRRIFLDVRICAYISRFLMDLEKKTHTLEIYLITAAIKPTLPRRIPVFAGISGSDQRQRSVEHQGCGRTPASCWLGTWKCKVRGSKISTGSVHFLQVKMVKMAEKWQWSSKGGRCGSKERKPEKLTSTSRWFHTFCFVLVMILGDGTPILHWLHRKFSIGLKRLAVDEWVMKPQIPNSP